MKKYKYKELLIILDTTIQRFIAALHNQKLSNMATTEWTVKDVLSHIVFWHMYYAQYYNAKANGLSPMIFKSKGGSIRNQQGVMSLKSRSKNELIQMLQEAQKDLYKSILTKSIPDIDYTDRKKYTTDDFLTIITGHIARHTLQIQNAK